MPEQLDQFTLERHARATGASVAQGHEPVTRPGTPARVVLAAGADPGGPGGADRLPECSPVDVRLYLALGAGAAVEWRELIVLGRTGNRPGRPACAGM